MDNCRSCKRKLNINVYQKAVNIGISPAEAIIKIDKKLNDNDLYKEVNQCCMLEYTSYN